jgi:hypothetical protein
LFACGGGGGSSAPATPAPPAPPPTPPAEAALVVTSANAEAVTVLGFGFGGIALGLGQLAVDWTAQVDSSATQSFVNQCLGGGGGTATATLTDRDGDHHASAGDTVSVVLLGCYLKELDDTVDGTVTVTLTAPLAGQQRAGVLTFSGFGVHNTTPRQDIIGALRFDYSASRLSKKVHVYSDTQSFGATFSDATKSFTDTVSALDATHETRLDTVRATTSMRFHVASNLLVGSFDVATPTEWSALLDTYPDAGEISATGANGSKASLRAAPAKAGLFDVLAAGTPLTTVSADGSGLLWTGAPWMPDVASAAHYTIQPASATVFRQLIAPAPAQIRPNGPLAWVYSRPVDPLSVSPATFYQRGYKTGMPAANVPAKITVEGGMVSYTPSVQLQLGVSYDLLQDTYGATVRDANGAVLYAPQFSGQVPQSVTASIASGPAVLLGSGATLVLDASGSSANGQPAASYRWHQLSGPALVLADATSARVTLSAAAGAGNGIAVVELEAANAAGEFDRLQVNVTVGADASTALVIAYRAGTAPVTVLSNIATPGSGYAHYLPTNNVLDVILENSRLLVGLNGQAWQAGQKLSYGAGNSSGIVGPGWLGCIGSTGNLSILEFALDQSGNLARLAVDVDDSCGATGVVTLASIRYHSTLPLRP